MQISEAIVASNWHAAPDGVDVLIGRDWIGAQLQCLAPDIEAAPCPAQAGQGIFRGIFALAGHPSGGRHAQCAR
jgi:hypothetical protein